MQTVTGSEEGAVQQPQPPPPAPAPLPAWRAKQRPPLVRHRDDKVLAGVAVGLAAHLGLPVGWVRFAFVVSSIPFGAGFVVYIFLWATMLEEGSPTTLSGMPSGPSAVTGTVGTSAGSPVGAVPGATPAATPGATAGSSNASTRHHGIDVAHRVVAALIHDRIVELEDGLGADGNAQAAALAPVDGDVQRLERVACVSFRPGWLDGDRHRLPPIEH